MIAWIKELAYIVRNYRRDQYVTEQYALAALAAVKKEREDREASQTKPA